MLLYEIQCVYKRKRFEGDREVVWSHRERDHKNVFALRLIAG